MPITDLNMETNEKEIIKNFQNLNLHLNHAKYSKNYSRSINYAELLFQNINDNLSGIMRQKYLEKLIASSIILINYPKRIIRKGTKKQSGVQFDASITCLLKSSYVKFSSVEIKPYMCIPNNVDNNFMKVDISSTKLQNLVLDNKDSWQIKNMKYQPPDDKRSSRRSTSDKNIILFDFKAVFQTSLLKNRIIKNLYSDTIVIVVHSNQEVDSLITLFWDDYYRENRDVISHQFPCKDHSSFEDLINNLSDYFYKETGRRLTDRNKNYLYQKLGDLIPSLDFIKFEVFMKQPLPGSKLSFGQWIMSIVKMLKIPCLEEMWRYDLIEGFISKDLREISLIPGSFILRFSERQAAIGVVTKTEMLDIAPWDPYLDSHLRSANLANLLDDFTCLKYIHKTDDTICDRESALKNFKIPSQIDDGYTKRGAQNTYEESEDMDTLDIDSNSSILIFQQDSTNIDEDALTCDLNDIYEFSNTILSDYDNITREDN